MNRFNGFSKDLPDFWFDLHFNNNVENEAEMKEKIEHLQTSIQAYDTEGLPMLITHFDTNKLSFGDNVFA